MLGQLNKNVWAAQRQDMTYLHCTPINIALIARTGPEMDHFWPAATSRGPELDQFWYLRQCLYGYTINSTVSNTPLHNTGKL